ncbi:MAG: DUF2334 domain-containing protein [Clostridia bacterium]|nr:DUF2334 domain-containing protein [Clostridia bacterium]
MVKLKKAVALMLALLMLFSLTAIANSGEISVFVNGSKLSFDVPPQIVNGRTMVPLRAIFESLGATVEWFEATRSVKAALGDKTVNLTIDSSTMYLNESAITLDAPAFVTDGRTLVPARAISEAFGATVGWNGETRTVTITTGHTELTYQEAFNALKSTLTGKGTEFSSGNFGARRDFGENGSTAFISYNVAEDRIVISYYSGERTSSVSLVLYGESADTSPMIVVSAEETVAFGAEYSGNQILVFHNETGQGNEDIVNRAVSNFTKASDIILRDMGCNVNLSSLGVIVTENIANSPISVESPDGEKTSRADYIAMVQSFNSEKLVGSADAASAELAAAIKGIPYFVPLAKNKGPVVILKADDLSVASYKTFKKMYDILLEEGIANVSFGAIGNRCTGEGNEDFWDFVKESVNSGVEIWHHGWTHDIGGDNDSEFSGRYDYDEMKKRVGDTSTLFLENAGYQITTMGAPGNKVNAEFAKMLNAEFPEIDKIFFSKGLSFNAHPLNTAIYPESGTNGVTFSHFKKVYVPSHEYTVIQFHPNRLNAYNLWDDFIKMIQYLRSQNCQFMTPSQYVNHK